LVSGLYTLQTRYDLEHREVSLMGGIHSVTSAKRRVETNIGVLLLLYKCFELKQFLKIIQHGLT